MQEERQADYHFGTVQGVRVVRNPKGSGRADFTLLITAQRGDFDGSEWTPRIGERSYVYALDASEAMLRQLQRTLLRSTEVPAVKDILLDIRQSLDQLSRRLPDA